MLVTAIQFVGLVLVVIGFALVLGVGGALIAGGASLVLLGAIAEAEQT
jgi:hypothetical protein